MSEKKEQWWILVKLLTICVCAFLYAWGGMEGKWLRRFVAPSVAGVTMFAFCRDWKVLMKVPILSLASIMGYGGDSLWEKVLKRLKVGFTFALGASSYEIFKSIRGEKNMWSFVDWCFFATISAYILLGVFNPFSGYPDGARIEETFLGLMVYSMAIMPVRRK